MANQSSTVIPGYMECYECGAPAIRWDCWIGDINRPKIFGNCSVCCSLDSTTELYTPNIEEAEIWLVNSTL